MRTNNEMEWRRRRELTALLVNRRAQLSRPDAAHPAAPGEPGLRQSDTAALAGMSTRHYAAFERGEAGHPSQALVEAVAHALRMAPPQRSALYVLALGHEPPAAPEDTTPRVNPLLRALVHRLSPYPAAVMDATWTLLVHNDAITEWFGDWYDRAAPAERNPVLYLFSPDADQRLADVHAERQAAIADLRHQYIRHNANPAFGPLITKLLANHSEARDLWNRYTLARPTATHFHRMRHPQHGTCELGRVTAAISSQLWLAIFIPPDRYLPAP